MRVWGFNRGWSYCSVLLVESEKDIESRDALLPRLFIPLSADPGPRVVLLQPVMGAHFHAQLRDLNSEHMVIAQEQPGGTTWTPAARTDLALDRQDVSTESEAAVLL